MSGDVLDKAVVERAVRGQDAVLSAIGAGAKRTTLREVGTKNIVEAMEKAGVQRLICQSSFGVGDSRIERPFFARYVIVAMKETKRRIARAPIARRFYH